MMKHALRVFTLLSVVMLVSVTVLEFDAHARAGGGKSMGSMGSRSYSRPAAPTYQPPPRPQQTLPPPTFQQPAPADERGPVPAAQHRRPAARAA